MKRLVLFLSLFIVVPVFAQEQSPEPYTRYCQVSAHDGNVNIYFGKEIVFPGKDRYLSDEKANPIKFKYGIDAVNYLSKRGWHLEQLSVSPWVVNGSSLPSTMIWVLSKTVTSDEEVLEGIITTRIVK